MKGRKGDRAQLSLPVVEAGIGVLLVLGIVSLVALGLPAPATGDPQLDAYAHDAATLLSESWTPDENATPTTIEEAIRTEEDFDREAEAIERRVDHLLPDNLLFQVETPHGAVGHDRPDGVPTGVASTTTPHGEVTVRVWYA